MEYIRHFVHCYTYMECKSCVVAGCTKNSGTYIKKHIAKVYALKKLFKHFHLIIFENDSTDNTLSVLKELETEHSDITILSEKNLVKRLDLAFFPGNFGYVGESERTSILAYARNRLIKKVEEDFGDWDYMIMADLDDIIAKFNINNFRKVSDLPENTWDVLTANRIGKYYDVWALRFGANLWTAKHQSIWGRILDFDCWDMIKHYKQRLGRDLTPSQRVRYRGNVAEYLEFVKKKRAEAVKMYITPWQRIIPVTAGLVPVVSAFGGLAIYKIEKIKGCRYSGIREKCDCRKYTGNNVGSCRRDQCEHVSFHKQMIAKHGAKIFIYSKLLLSGGHEHIL